MLPSKERLNRREFIETLKNKVSVVYNNIGTFKYIPIVDKGFSIVVSSKHEKSAVKRNKLKRRIYDLFKNKDIQLRGILYVSSKSYSMEYDEIKKLIHDLLEKVSKNNK